MFTTNETDEVATTPTECVLDALAAKAECEPIDLSTPLFEVVDPDALDAVLGSGDANHEVYVGFAFEGHAVQVHGDGTVYVDGERYDPKADTFETA